MGIFDRFRRPAPPPPGGHDTSVLPTLDPDRADRLIALAHADLAGRGLEATIHVGHLELAGGEVFGLHNLSVIASRAPERDWPQIIARHMDLMLDPPSNDGPPDPGAVLARLRLHSDLPRRPHYEAVEPFPGLMAIIAVDHPEHVSELMNLPEGIPDVATAMSLARRNLTELEPPHHESVLIEHEDESSRVHFFGTDDFFGAARLLVLDDLLGRAGIPMGPGGVLVSAPHRHVVTVHAITGPSVFAVMKWMVAFTRNEYETQPGPVSPEVYHSAPDGRTMQVTQPGDSGTAVVVEGSFAECFTAVLGGED